jgi:hypothetical protein
MIFLITGVSVIRYKWQNKNQFWKDCTHKYCKQNNKQLNNE